ncbi:MAG: ATP-binding cassette domain-containing protein, partial [Nitrospirae bacterium]|nr:ATP-binding cassette domain-containing protein [Nitrospirota bacterium]
TGLAKEDSGKIFYNGINFKSDPIECKRLIGIVPQNSNVDRDLTAYENLYMQAILYSIPVNERKKKINEILDFAGLIEYKDKQVKTFSGGMKRRLTLIRALLHQPKILYLDEPTVGLDPQIRRSMWELILKINQQKSTSILLTTHYIEEAERLCGKVMIINNGKIIIEGSPDELKKGIGHFVLEEFVDDAIKEDFFETKETALNHLKDCVNSCKIREVSLEDVFIKLTGKRINA